MTNHPIILGHQGQRVWAGLPKLIDEVGFCRSLERKFIDESN